MKMLRECRATQVLCFMWDVEFDGDIHFWIGSEEMSMPGQIKSTFKIPMATFPSFLSFLVFSQYSKKRHLFSRKTIRNAKITFQEVTSPLPTCFFL